MPILSLGLARGNIMSGDTPDRIAEIRYKAAEIEFRAKSSTLYFKQLQEDPDRVLSEAGFDAPTANRLIAQLRGDPEDPCGDICDGITCLVTSCCWWTLNPVPEPVPTKA
jgi:hypothetical protein